LTTDKEFERVLKNPENIIISKSLEGILSNLEEHSDKNEFSEHFKKGNSLKIGERIHLFSLKKLEIETDIFSLTLEVPSLSTKELFVPSTIEVEIEGEQFAQIPSEIVSWENNLLTIKTRRIFNETV